MIIGTNQEVDLEHAVTNQNSETTNDEIEIVDTASAIAEAKRQADIMRTGSESDATPTEQPADDVKKEIDPLDNDSESDATDKEQPESTDEVDFSAYFTKPIVLKDRGLELPINSIDELIKIANQGLNYTRKNQDISEARKTIDYMREQNISEQELQLLASIKAGSKEALAHLANSNGIDPLYIDADDGAKYKPSDKVAFRETSEVDNVAIEIMERAPEVASQIRDLTQYVPPSFKTLLSTDPRVLRGFAADISNGFAQKIIPEAIKQHTIYPSRNFVDIYLEVGDKIFGKASGEKQVEQAKAVVAPVTKNADALTKAKAIIQAKSASRSTPTEVDTETDIWTPGMSSAEVVAAIKLRAAKARNN